MENLASQPLGMFNVTSVVTMLCSVFLLAIWIPAHGTAGAIVFAVAFGFALNFIVAATPVLVSQVSEFQELGLRVGIVWGVSSIGAISGIPIGSSLIKGDNYVCMKIFGGVVVAGAAFFFALSRYFVGGRAIFKKV